MSAEVVEVRPQARANARVFTACTVPGCHTISKTYGLCNAHYMEYYRRTNTELHAEVADATRRLGSPEEYFCEGTDSCDEPAVRWYVKDGKHPQAFCAKHSATLIDWMRMEIRRLELKT